MEIDSLAYKRDSSYWEAERAIPLSIQETKSYTTKDSLILIDTKNKNDSVKAENKNLTFTPSEIKIRIDSTSSISWALPEINYNTVEQYNFISSIAYKKRFVNKNILTITPLARYATAKGQFTGKATINYQYGKDNSSGIVMAEAGRYITQFNFENPISNIINTIATLFFESNYMKLYEKEYLKLSLNQSITDKLSISVSSELANRFMLKNSAKATSYFDWKENSFSDNSPLNNEIFPTDFNTNTVFVTQVGLKYSILKKYFITNGEKRAVRNSSPILKLNYRKAFSGVLNSTVDYDFLELGIVDQFKIGIRGNIDAGINVGSFLNSNKIYFMDYKHFMGNRTFIQQQTIGFRMLDYYKYSTRKYFAECFLYLRPAKMLLTQFTVPRMVGLKENIFINYLYTPSSANYMEMGYGLDQIFRLFRLEIVSNFSDFKFQSIEFRIGFSARISNRIK